VGQGIETTGEVRFVVSSLVHAGEYLIPEGPVLQALLTGLRVPAPAYVATAAHWVEIATRRPKPGDWWVLLVGRFAVTFFPFSRAEIVSRRNTGQESDLRVPPGTIDELWSPLEGEGLVWELWNVKVRSLTR